MATAAAIAFAALACSLSAPPSSAPAPRGPVADLDRFTVDGVGLLSTPEEVRARLGAPEEEQRISAVVDEAERERERRKGEEEEEDLDTRAPARQQGRLVYSYYAKGVKVVFLEETRRIESIDLCIRALPPYSRFAGSFAQPFSTDVREAELLRPLADRIYKDAPGALFLRKDKAAPKRETAVLSFNVEGWLTGVRFCWEENYEIDFDRLSVAGVSLGDPAAAAVDRLGPPDRAGTHGRHLVGAWDREGLKIYANRSDGRIRRIVGAAARFDGECVQGLPLSTRKEGFHAFLKGRIYQESSSRICAYRKGGGDSPERLILTFDESDRMKIFDFDILRAVEIDFGDFSVGGIRIGDPAAKVRSVLGATGRWRRSGRSIILGYPDSGLRVFLSRAGEPKGAEKTRGFKWEDLGEVRKIDAPLATSASLRGKPFFLGAPMEAWEKDAARMIFGRKGVSLYLSPDGKPPSRGVAAVVEFEKVGWPKAVTVREFNSVVVDMRNFSVSGVTIGTHRDEVLRALGRPERGRVIERDNLEVMRYIEKGVTVVIDRLSGGVCKVTVEMDRFEGSFAQDLTADSNSDDFEKAAHAQVYRQDEKHLWLSPDGRPPTWEEGVVTFGLSGDVETIVFRTLAVRKEGFLLDVTSELE